MKSLLAALCCAAALAVFIAPGARADEYTKQTFLTFSGPVQVPGATLPAGTYMFKLADPDTGRRAIQIWDKEGTNLIAMLLTIPNDRMEASDEPVVLFSETAVGNPQAVKAWFYPGDRTGMEFIYPKDQAMRIARDSRTSVLSYNDDLNANSDTTVMRGTKVGRMDAAGQIAELDAEAPQSASAATNTSPAATAATVDNTTTASQNREEVTGTTASTAAPPATDNQANRSGAPAPTATTASTATASTATTAAAAPAPTDNQANRSGAPAPTATAGNAATSSAEAMPSSTAPRSETAAPAPVGTSGQAGSTNAQATGASADQAASRQELPRTASSLTALQLLAGMSLLGSLSVRQLRRRYAANRR